MRGRGRSRPMVVPMRTARSMHGVADRERVPIGIPVRTAMIIDLNRLCDRLGNRHGLQDRLGNGRLLPQGLRNHLRGRDHPERSGLQGVRVHGAAPDRTDGQDENQTPEIRGIHHASILPQRERQGNLAEENRGRSEGRGRCRAGSR